MKNPNIKNTFTRFYIRWCGIYTVSMFKIWARLFCSPSYKVMLRPIHQDEKIVVISNHQTLLDCPVIFTALPFSLLYRFSPVKFMTWHKYYNGKFRSILYSNGCYPSHGDGYAGVKGAVHFAKWGYSSFIFPEGKRTNPTDRKPAYRGVSDILKQLPDARIILVHIDWEPRRAKLARPKFSVTFADAPKALARTNPDKIMDAIYKL